MDGITVRHGSNTYHLIYSDIIAQEPKFQKSQMEVLKESLKREGGLIYRDRIAQRRLITAQDAALLQLDGHINRIRSQISDIRDSMLAQPRPSRETRREQREAARLDLNDRLLAQFMANVQGESAQGNITSVGFI